MMVLSGCRRSNEDVAVGDGVAKPTRNQRGHCSRQWQNKAVRRKRSGWILATLAATDAYELLCEEGMISAA